MVPEPLQTALHGAYQVVRRGYLQHIDLFGRSRFAQDPAKRLRLERIGRHDHLVDMITGRALECVEVEAGGAGCDAYEQHSGKALGTAGVLNRRGDGAGHEMRFWHGPP